LATRLGIDKYAGTTDETKAGPVWNGTVRLHQPHLDQPLRWKRPRRIFVNSMSDLFHEALSDEDIDKVFAVMATANWHTFQILTKRADRMRDYCRSFVARHSSEEGRNILDRTVWPLPNVWLGVSVEDQAAADARVPALLDTPAAVRWLSCEPLLGPVDLTRVGYGEDPFDECGGHPESAIGAVATGMWWDATTGHFWSDNRHGDGSRSGLELSARYPRIDWVVCGGESGARSRPMHPDWARGLRDQCAATSLPFLFKQWGEWTVTYDRDAEDPDWRRCPTARNNNERYLNLAGGHGFHGERMVFVRKSGKKAAGRLLDGVLHDGYPEV
ncbi:MAG: phage Gp37/Gp68 family protein, partial [Magnetospirillum sp.]|nr:phage Gp37/Gp68 family protein [Magnetospirillum sp.]